MYDVYKRSSSSMDARELWYQRQNKENLGLGANSRSTVSDPISFVSGEIQSPDPYDLTPYRHFCKLLAEQNSI
jgi:hypothetical protein